MRKIAFLGDENNGEEILNILQLLGGDNIYKCHCNNKGCFYYIDDENHYIISGFITQDNLEENFKLFTIEDFQKSYPHKPGEHIVFNGGSVEPIVTFRWNEQLEDIIYISYSGAEKQQNTVTTPKQTINKIDFTSENYENEVEIELGNDREIINENGKIKIIKKKFPTSFQECCAVLGIQVGGELFYDVYDGDDDGHYSSHYNNELLNKLDDFRRLIVCRDAYWKMLGNWEPNWEDETDKYTISLRCGKIHLNNNKWYSEVLAFPTTEIRNEFYEYFKDLIEKCKYFL